MKFHSANKDNIMKRYILVLSAFIISCIADAIPSRPSPARLVNDFSDLFTPSQEAELERMLVAFDDSTSNQIAVITVKDLEGYEASEYATRIGLDWGVGSSKFDNGIVILVKPKTSSSGQVFIAVGYGLEGAVPDAYAKRIINHDMIPHFMENDYYKGVSEACITLMQLASGEISEPRDGEESGPSDMEVVIIIILIAFICLMYLLSKEAKKNNRNNNGGGRSTYTGPVITTGTYYGSQRRSSGSSGNFGSFGGGGFSGGFGGFGGGSFGGGGAGGSW